MESKENEIPRRALACAAAAAAFATHADAAAAKPFGARPLHLHSHGHDVRVLQAWLTRLGFAAAVDGRYGRLTRRAVRGYERRYELKVDGRVSRSQARGIRRRYLAAAAAVADPAAPVGLTDGPDAVLSEDGRTALAPAAAPQPVKDAIGAANRIVGKPYRYGGGHGSFEDSGYDCSGTVSYALHGAGLLDAPLDSTGFESYGRKGAGDWITVYANSGHAYAVIAGLRLDTSGPGESGPHWRPEARSSKGYDVRHPVGY